MTLRLEASIPARGFDVSLSVAAGETVAILGPNGAGKSTLLGVLAGLVKPERGRAELASRTLFDLAPGKKPVWVPPHLRGVALLAQEPLLFPHLSALENVAFGPKSTGAGASAAHSLAAHWLEEVEAADLGARKPARLSGGQAQRVAVARALAASPRLLLLDEPLSALDVAVAPLLRRMLRRVLADRTVLIVTHDVLDALTLADRVIVMKDGVIIEEGPTRLVLERPRNRFTADLAALNLVTGIRTERGLRTADGVDVLTRPDPHVQAGVPAAVAIRPADVAVSTDRPDAGSANVFRLTVTDLEPRGDLIRVRTDTLFTDVPPRVVADLDLAPGSNAYFTFRPTDTTIYPL